jgi:predicted ATPase/class 3 adenylate cyclase
MTATRNATLLFTDIEGSTRMLDALGNAFGDVVADHRALLRQAIERFGGVETATEGDAHHAVFDDPVAAVAAAMAAQRSLRAYRGPQDVPVLVRMGVHTGPVSYGRGEYFGMGFHGAARVCSSAHGGQIVLSDATVDALAGRLPDGASVIDLGYHVLKDLGAAIRLYQVVHDDLHDEFPALRTLSVLPNNLPAELSSFIGREPETQALRERLDAARLVTVTGPGGAGKTRLALQVAAELLDAYDDGVWLVELAGVGAGDEVADAVASELGVRDEAGRPIGDTLAERLGTEHRLLVLDNCEQVSEATAHLVYALLRAAPHLRVLCTSREPLGLRGEVVLTLPPMRVPPETAVDANAVLVHDGARLFAERAAAVRTGWQLDDEDAPHVANICRRLDGLPLAIELAAARANVLTPKQIDDRLADRLGLLRSPDPTIADRQRTLHSLIDWSYDLLEPDEQALFRRLGVFVAGFSLEAAEAVCGTDTFDVLDVLARLVFRSLVVTERHGDELRYRLLETIRLYARDRLRDSNEEAEIGHRHTGYFVTFAERARHELEGRDQARWLTRVSLDHDNFRQALRAGLAEPGAGPAVRLVVQLRYFLTVRGHVREGLEWARRAVAIVPDDAQVLAALGSLQVFLEPDAARATLERSIELAERNGDDDALEKALINLGNHLDRLGDFEMAHGLFERHAALCASHGDRLGEAASIGNLGNIALRTNDLDRAEELLRRAYGLLVEGGNVRNAANTLHSLGILARARGDMVLSYERHAEATAMARDLEDIGALAQHLTSLAHAARWLGRTEHAIELQEEAVALARRVGSGGELASALEALGVLLAGAGDGERSERAYREALDEARAAGDAVVQVTLLHNLALWASIRGDTDESERLMRESLELARRLSQSGSESGALVGLAKIAIERSASDEAVRLASEAVEAAERSGEPIRVVEALQCAGEASVAAGRLEDAAAGFEDAQRRWEELGYAWAMSEPMAWLSRVALKRGDVDTAATLADEALRRALDAPSQNYLRLALERLACVADARGDAVRGAEMRELTARLERGDASVGDELRARGDRG